jgi:hypothetical protein
MGRLRYTIGGLMLLVLAVAASAAIFRSPARLRTDATFSLVLLLNLVAVVLATSKRGRARRGWIGFATFGWAYLTFAFAPWFQSEVRPHLVTTQWIDAAYLRAGGPYIPPRADAPAALTIFSNLGMHEVATPETRDRWQGLETYADAQRTGHSLAAILFAAIGAMVALLNAPRDEVPPE